MKVIKKNVLVLQDMPNEMKGGLYLPAGKEEFSNIGTVLAIGNEVTDVKEGDRVVFKRKPDSAIEAYARPRDPYYGHLILPEDHILAIVEES